MKLKQLMACVLVAALFAACAAACKNGGANVEIETLPPVTQAPVTLPPETLLPETQPAALPEGIVEDNSFIPAAMDKAGVLRLYTEAVNNVKLRCPGFTKTQTQAVDNVSAGSGVLSLANRIMNLVAAELISTAGGGSETVPAHADVAVLEKFPLYGQTVGCALTDLSLIENARCDTNGEIYRVVIQLGEVVNPDTGNSEFCKILTPVQRKNVAGGIAGFLQRLELDRYLFDFRYTNAEITAEIERDTGRLIRLSHRVVLLVDVDLDLDVLFIGADLIEAHGTVINKIEYTDFDWTP